jgi:hypothetical protein
MSSSQHPVECPQQAEPSTDRDAECLICLESLMSAKDHYMLLTQRSESSESVRLVRSGKGGGDKSVTPSRVTYLTGRGGDRFVPVSI